MAASAALASAAALAVSAAALAAASLAASALAADFDGYFYSSLAIVTVFQGHSYHPSAVSFSDRHSESLLY